MKILWLLVDLSNGDSTSKNYCWVFTTHKRAKDFKKTHSKDDCAQLSGPVRCLIDSLPNNVINHLEN